MLVKSITLENGIQFEVSIIDKIIIDKTTATIHVLYYKDETYYQNQLPEVKSTTHFCIGDEFNTHFSRTHMRTDGLDIYDIAYEWLLTLPLYEGATYVSS